MRALYLSYDGMTDPLGGSQVIPYLKGLAARGHEITLISFEKPDRFRESGAQIAHLLKASQIDWRPLRYHKHPPVLSTVWDLLRMRRLASRLASERNVQLVHCRSYISAIAALPLKQRFGIRLVFDMRGFYADERVDGGLWNLRRPLYRAIYRFFKRKELELLNAADEVVCLTHAGKAEMGRWPIARGAAERIHVIPCCADLAHFDRMLVSEPERARLARELEIDPAADYVVSYLGSLGTWYLLDEMMVFFRALRRTRAEAKFLLITIDPAALVLAAAARAGVPEAAIRVRAASRAEVPVLLSLSRVNVFFIRPSYSKIASSPTKMAEVLSMGLPVVTNAGVGDTDWLASRYGVAVVVRGFGEPELAAAVERLGELERLGPERPRAAARDYFSLERGVEAYQRIYAPRGPLP